MSGDSVLIKEYAATTPFGDGLEPLWDGLMAKRSALKPARRFETASFAASSCAEAELEIDADRSLVWSLLDPIREKVAAWKPDHLLLATTKGEIDLLETELRGNRGVSPRPGRRRALGAFLERALAFFGVPRGTVVSAACASSNVAIQRAAEMLLAGRCERPVVVGVDLVSKFVFSGFSALQALSPTDRARPFDRDRDGLLVGEAAVALLLELGDPASNGRAIIAGWGSSSDANHVTGPSRDGAGLAAAIRGALRTAGMAPKDVAAVCAHGTGTLYNDSMEMRALRTVLPRPVPAFSAKGATGHTMGAAGALETLLCVKCLETGAIPPTVGLASPDPLAEEWVSDESAEIAGGALLNVNSGFGGINAALLIS